MPLQLTALHLMEGTQIQVMFNDGRCAAVDLAPLLNGPVFRELQHPDAFRGCRLDPDLGTVVWPNGADLAPEAIYFQAFRDDPSLTQLFERWGYLPAGSTSATQR